MEWSIGDSSMDGCWSSLCRRVSLIVNTTAAAAVVAAANKAVSVFAKSQHCFCILPASVIHFMSVWVFLPTLERPQKGGVGTYTPSAATTEHLSMYVCV